MDDNADGIRRSGVPAEQWVEYLSSLSAACSPGTPLGAGVRPLRIAAWKVASLMNQFREELAGVMKTFARGKGSP